MVYSPPDINDVNNSLYVQLTNSHKEKHAQDLKLLRSGANDYCKQIILLLGSVLNEKLDFDSLAASKKSILKLQEEVEQLKEQIRTPTQPFFEDNKIPTNKPIDDSRRSSLFTRLSLISNALKITSIIAWVFYYLYSLRKNSMLLTELIDLQKDCSFYQAICKTTFTEGEWGVRTTTRYLLFRYNKEMCDGLYSALNCSDAISAKIKQLEASTKEKTYILVSSLLGLTGLYFRIKVFAIIGLGGCGLQALYSLYQKFRPQTTDRQVLIDLYKKLYQEKNTNQFESYARSYLEQRGYFTNYENEEEQKQEILFSIIKPIMQEVNLTNLLPYIEKLKKEQDDFWDEKHEHPEPQIERMAILFKYSPEPVHPIKSINTNT